MSDLDICLTVSTCIFMFAFVVMSILCLILLNRLNDNSLFFKTKKDILVDISRSIGSLSNNLDKVVTFNTSYINFLNNLHKEDKIND